MRVRERVTQPYRGLGAMTIEVVQYMYKYCLSKHCASGRWRSEKHHAKNWTCSRSSGHLYRSRAVKDKPLTTRIELATRL